MKIIQAPDAAAIKLQSNHFGHFDQLRALSLQGRESNGESLSMILHADTLKQLVQLRYLSLKSLKLLDEPSADMLVFATDQMEDQEEEEVVLAGGNNSSRLVYLKEKVQEEILPYEEYKKMKEQLWDGFTALKRLEYLGVIDCQLPEAFTSGHSAAFSTLSNLKELVIRSSQLRVRLETGPGELKSLVALSLAGTVTIGI